MSRIDRPRGGRAPLEALRDAGLYTYYWLYYQEPGVADAEYGRDPRMTLRRRLYTSSGDAPPNGPDPYVLKPGKVHSIALLILTPSIVAYRSGPRLYGCGFEAHRISRRTELVSQHRPQLELLAPWSGAPIQQPALFIAGAEDPVIASPTGKAPLAAMKTTVPNLKSQVIIEGAGHYIQQERPTRLMPR